MMKVKRIFILLIAVLICAGFINLEKCANAETQHQIYENKKFGFVFKFPNHWNGCYIINEKNQNYIEVSFVGKSMTSKNISPDTKKPLGLTMFYIGKEKYVKTNEFIDGAREVGVARKIKYYYYTNSDYPISALFDAYNDPECDKEEKTDAFNDYQKAKKMEKDIKGILKTFKCI